MYELSTLPLCGVHTKKREKNIIVYFPEIRNAISMDGGRSITCASKATIIVLCSDVSFCVCSSGTDFSFSRFETNAPKEPASEKNKKRWEQNYLNISLMFRCQRPISNYSNSVDQFLEPERREEGKRNIFFCSKWQTVTLNQIPISDPYATQMGTIDKNERKKKKWQILIERMCCRSCAQSSYIYIYQTENSEVKRGLF